MIQTDMPESDREEAYEGWEMDEEFIPWDLDSYTFGESEVWDLIEDDR